MKKAGAEIDGKKLEEKIGVSVVEISALKGIGIAELMDRAYEECKKGRKGSTVLKDCPLGHLINDVRIALEGSGKVDNPLFHAIKLVEIDALEAEAHSDLIKMVEEFKESFCDDVFGDDFEAVIADAGINTYQRISPACSPSLRAKTGCSPSRTGLTG